MQKVSYSIRLYRRLIYQFLVLAPDCIPRGPKHGMRFWTLWNETTGPKHGMRFGTWNETTGLALNME